jgi:hypothetical protein
MAATPGLPGSPAARTGRSTPVILRIEERRISAARRSTAPAVSGISILAAGRPWSTKTNARPQGLSWTGREAGRAEGPGAHAAAQRRAQAAVPANTTAPARILTVDIV